MPDPSPLKKDAVIVTALTSFMLRNPSLRVAVPSVSVEMLRVPALKSSPSCTTFVRPEPSPKK